MDGGGLRSECPGCEQLAKELESLILSDGSVVDGVKFPDEIRDFLRSGMRAKNDSGGLKADRTTINPQRLKWGESRATISAVRIIATPDGEDKVPTPVVPIRQAADERLP